MFTYCNVHLGKTFPSFQSAFCTHIFIIQQEYEHMDVYLPSWTNEPALLLYQSLKAYTYMAANQSWVWCELCDDQETLAFRNISCSHMQNRLPSVDQLLWSLIVLKHSTRSSSSGCWYLNCWYFFQNLLNALYHQHSRRHGNTQSPLLGCEFHSLRRMFSSTEKVLWSCWRALLPASGRAYHLGSSPGGCVH